MNEGYVWKDQAEEMTFESPDPKGWLGHHTMLSYGSPQCGAELK